MDKATASACRVCDRVHRQCTSSRISAPRQAQTLSPMKSVRVQAEHSHTQTAPHGGQTISLLRTDDWVSSCPLTTYACSTAAISWQLAVGPSSHHVLSVLISNTIIAVVDMQSFNILGHGPWSLPSTFTTQASVPGQPDPPVQVASSKVCKQQGKNLGTSRSDLGLSSS